MTHLTLHDLRRTDQMDRETLEAENRRLIEALATALQHLEKGRALWNGPCHQCAYVLRDALGMGEQSALAAEPASGEAQNEVTLDSNTDVLSLVNRLEDRIRHLKSDNASLRDVAAVNAAIIDALRQRADEATRVENEACAKVVDEHSDRMDDWYGERADEIAAAIRARIAPKIEL